MMDFDDVKPFIWKKKYEELGIEIDEEKLLDEARKRIEENKVELEKIRERQRKRELEHQQRLNEVEFLQRQKELEHHEHWEQQETDFIRRQDKLRSKIRIRDGRAKPIDLLVHYIDMFGDKHDDKPSNGYLQDDSAEIGNLHVELVNPCDWLNRLSLDDLEKLIEDLKVHKEADIDINQDYWNALLDLAYFEKFSIQLDKSSSDATILDEVVAIFKEKTINELDKIEKDLGKSLDDGDIDENFYQIAILKLKSYRARKQLTNKHEKNLKKSQEKIDADRLLEDIPISTSSKIEDVKSDSTDQSGEAAFLHAARDGMEQAEAIFNCEFEVSKPHGYEWASRYQPRKPTYLNRVHTGFRWNNYNRTHYDIDNPPPKTVLGYKFNIYYPDLINKSDTPQFFVTPCADDKDFAIIRFSAGPPYEDIAFKILNKDWNKSPRSGYKCQFKRGALQLWFMFKQYKYRR